MFWVLWFPFWRSLHVRVIFLFFWLSVSTFGLDPDFFRSSALHGYKYTPSSGVVHD
jgi:hypothetical protein